MTRYDHERSEACLRGCGSAVAAAVLGVLLLAMTGVCGCSPSQLQRHVAAAQVTRSALDVAAVGIETACDPDAVGLRDDAAERARRCLGAAASHDTARAAWVSYASALVLAADDGKVDLLIVLPLGRSLLDAYREVAEAVELFGGKMPPVPALLGGL